MNIKQIRFKKGLKCPNCGHQKIVLWGKRNGIQRYHCKTCRKYFNDLTGTPMAYSKKLNKWPSMTKALQLSLTVKQTAEFLDVSISTAFRWRHRLLSGLKVFRTLPVLSGIVEIDETMFRYSEKGSRQLSRKSRKRGKATQRGRSKEQVYAVIARDRNLQTRSFLLTQMSGKALIDKVGPAINSESQICTDYWRSYQTFAVKLNLKHIRLNMSKNRRVVHGIYHIQNVNAYHSRLKNWIRRFKGVATKYLPNYLVWFEHLDESTKFLKGLGEQKLYINSLYAA